MKVSVPQSTCDMTNLASSAYMVGCNLIASTSFCFAGDNNVCLYDTFTDAIHAVNSFRMRHCDVPRNNIIELPTAVIIRIYGNKCLDC